MSHNSDSKRNTLDILLADYTVSREDARGLATTFGTVVGFALASLSVLGWILAHDIRIRNLVFATQDIDVSNSLPDPLLAMAPLIPVALVSYTTIISITIVMQSYYLRHLERKIAQCDRGTDLHTFPAWAEIEANVTRMSRGFGITRPFAILLIVVATVVFGGFTIAILLVVRTPWKVSMVAGYGGVIALMFRRLHQITHDGRASYALIERVAYSALRNDSLSPAHDKISGRLAYNLLPRRKVDFFAKGIGLSFLASCAAFMYGDSPLENLTITSVGTWVIAVLLFEILCYQARYVLNDLRGHTSDLDHPNRTSRKRLGVFYADPAEATRAALTNLGLRVLLFLVAVQFFPPSIRISLIVASVSLLVSSSIYDSIRDLDVRTKRRGLTIAWAAHLTVGIGYAIRGFVGFSVAVFATREIPKPGHTALVCIYFYLLGILGVSIAWCLDAVTHVDREIYAADRWKRRDAILVSRALWSKPQLYYHLNFLGIQRSSTQDLPDETRKELLGYRVRFLDRGDRFVLLRFLPQTASLSYALILAGLVVKASTPIVAILFILGSVASGLITKLDHRGRWVTGGVTVTSTAIVLLLTSNNYSLSLIALALAPALVVIVSCTLGRSRSRFEQADAISVWIATSLKNNLRLFIENGTRFILGPSVSTWLQSRLRGRSLSSDPPR